MRRRRSVENRSRTFRNEKVYRRTYRNRPCVPGAFADSGGSCGGDALLKRPIFFACGSALSPKDESGVERRRPVHRSGFEPGRFRFESRSRVPCHPVGIFVRFRRIGVRLRLRRSDVPPLFRHESPVLIDGNGARFASGRKLAVRVFGRDHFDSAKLSAQDVRLYRHLFGAVNLSFDDFALGSGQRRSAYPLGLVFEIVHH